MSTVIALFSTHQLCQHNRQSVAVLLWFLHILNQFFVFFCLLVFHLEPPQPKLKTLFWSSSACCAHFVQNKCVSNDHIEEEPENVSIPFSRQSTSWIIIMPSFDWTDQKLHHPVVGPLLKYHHLFLMIFTMKWLSSMSLHSDQGHAHQGQHRPCCLCRGRLHGWGHNLLQSQHTSTLLCHNYFVGFAGMYCLKERRPLKEIIPSSPIWTCFDESLKFRNRLISSKQFLGMIFSIPGLQ